MIVDYTKVRRIIINVPITGGKPNKETLRRLGLCLPDARVIGFGFYGFLNYWYLLVESKQFASIDDGGISNILLSALRMSTSTDTPPPAPPAIPKIIA